MAGRRRIRFLVGLGLLGLLAPPAPSQTVEHVLEEREKVALRLIDVTVLQKNGRPFRGLGPEDFTVRMAGSEREIVSFDAAVGRAIVSPAPDPEPLVAESGAVEPPVVSEAGRWIVICLDADRIPHNYRKIVLETARALIRDGTRPEDRVAVALLLNGRVSLLQPFSPPAQIELALLENPGMLLGSASDIRYRIDEMVELVRSCPESRQDACVITRTEEFLLTIHRANESGLRALRGLVGSLAPLPGRKALVWLSNGFLLEPGVVVMEAMTRYLGSDPDLIYSRLKDIGNEGYQSLQWEASRARVTFYSLRAGHDISHAMRSAQEASNPRRISGVAGNPYKMAAKLGEEALRDVAEATGGRAIFTPIGPGVATDLLQNLEAIYTLGVAVRPDDPIRPRIKVHLRKELKGKIRVTRPLPWRALPPELLTAWLTFPPELSAGFGGSVAVRLHLSRAGLVTEEGRGKSRQCRVALYVQVRGPEGLVLDHTYAILELPVGSVKDDSFTYNLTFRLGPGEYLAEASVSDLIGGGQVSVAEKLTVPVAAAAN